jgi:hypothetical protein
MEKELMLLALRFALFAAPVAVMYRRLIAAEHDTHRLTLRLPIRLTARSPIRP